MPDNRPRSHDSFRPEPSREYSEKLSEIFSAPLEGAEVAGGEKGELLRGGLASGHAAYRLRKAVAEGGHGEIWEAIQVSLNRVVAIKRVRKHLRESDREIVRKTYELAFVKEALINGVLDHPNIVPVYDLGADEAGSPLIAMKLVKGQSWDDLLLHDRETDRAEFLSRHLRILVAVAHAVEFAHSRGLIHRDLKPSQVMVGEFGEAYLMDWGLAACFDMSRHPPGVRAREHLTALEHAPSPAGTASYMAPEQTLDTAVTQGPWTDMFLLGGMLYCILTGRPPYATMTSREAFKRARAWDLVAPALAARDKVIPDELNQLCMDAMARKPEDRIASVGEFIARIEAFLSGSNRRDEARRLAAEAEAILHGEGSDYERLSRADSLLSRSLDLWPDYPRARELGDEVCRDFAGSAIRAGDLGLAHALAARVRNEPARHALAGQIEARARVLQRRARQRTAALAACFVLLGASGLGGWHAVNRRADANIETAREARQSMLAALNESVDKLLTEEAALTEQLTKAWREELRLPPVLARMAFHDAALEARKDTFNFDQLLARRDEMLARRRDLAARGAVVPPERPALALTAGITLLYKSRDKAGLGAALAAFEYASQAGEVSMRAIVGKAEALLRMGNPDGAVGELQQALAAARVMFDRRFEFEWINSLMHEAHRTRHQAWTLPAEAVLIEPLRSDGQYREEGGGWITTQRPREWARSAAAGTSRELAGARAVRIDKELKPEERRAAIYEPRLPAPGEYHVYVTWPCSANATNICYTVKHASGESSITLMQDGWGDHGPTVANQWVSLGAYEFASQGGALIVENLPDWVSVSSTRDLQMAADAVVFSPTSLEARFTTGTEATSAAAVRAGVAVPDSDTTSAINRARDEGKHLVFMNADPGTNAGGFLSERLLHRNVAVSELLNNRYVFVTSRFAEVFAKVDPEHERYPSGALVVCTPDGKVVRWLPPSEFADAGRVAKWLAEE